MDRRTDLEAEIRDRLRDLFDEAGVESAMLNVAYSVIAAKSGAGKLSLSERKRIQENYPEATDALVEERALDEIGVASVIMISSTLSRIAVDYSPLSHVAHSVAADDKLPPSVGDDVNERIRAALDQAGRTGMSPLGVMATAVLVAVHRGLMRDHLPWPVAVRVLLDGITLALEGTGDTRPLHDAIDEAVDALASRLGVSKATARKNVAQAGVPFPPRRRGRPRKQ